MAVHKTARATWNQVQSCRDLHPGLAFYVYFAGDPTNVDDKEAHFERLRGLAHPDAGLLHRRRLAEVAGLRQMGYTVECWHQALDAPLAAGLGIASPTENGITLERVHGLPVLPGTSLKGIAQDQALDEALDGELEEPTPRWTAKNAPEFIAMFGLQTPLDDEKQLGKHWRETAHRGAVVFLDAVPLGKDNRFFDVDIVNPHYMPYYSSEGQIPPADYHTPKPNNFLTVRTGAVFTFTVAARGVSLALTPASEEAPAVKTACTAADLASRAARLLQDGLSGRGAGGKTRVGYGYFREPSACPEPAEGIE